MILWVNWLPYFSSNESNVRDIRMESLIRDYDERMDPPMGCCERFWICLKKLFC